MADVYQRADDVLIPTMVEGGAMSLLEGLAMGRPVIAPEFTCSRPAQLNPRPFPCWFPGGPRHQGMVGALRRER